jgi:carbonic anhydrase
MRPLQSATSLTDRILTPKSKKGRLFLWGGVSLVYGILAPGCAHANVDPLDRELPSKGHAAAGHGDDGHGAKAKPGKAANQHDDHDAHDSDEAHGSPDAHGVDPHASAPPPAQSKAAAKAPVKKENPAAHGGGHGSAPALTPAAAQMAAATAMIKLKEGNERYVTGNAGHPRQNRDRRTEVAKGQKPFAVVVTCADSRVPPEIVFDQGLGDLFIVRTAGEVIDNAALGSIEYAVDHMDVALILVLGHERCGAVDAACKKVVTRDHIDYLVEAISPAVVVAQKKPGDLLANAISANVDRVVDQLKSSWPTLATRARDGRLQVVGAVYDLDMGIVQFQ